MQELLAGVRVVDLGRYIAGPYCAALLADLGATVIRVERVGGGEDRAVAPVAPDGAGALFLQCNRGKLGMTLDPFRPEGRVLLGKLVASADVLVANLPPAALAAMGLDLAALRETHPRLVVTTMTAFGSGGPYSDKVGFDGMGQALSGAMHMTGSPGEPTRAGINFVDFTTALSGAVGTLAALLHRQQSGEGQHVETSLFASALTVTNSLLIEEALLGRQRVATKSRGQFSGPSDAFHTRDGWIVVQCFGRPMFERCAKVIGAPEWLSDPRFAEDIDRGDHGEALSERMAQWCAERSTAEALEALEAGRIPAGQVLTPRSALDDPHVRAVPMLVPIDYPGLSAPAPISPAPFRLSATPAQPRGRAPMLGEHTAQILAELGYAAEEIAGLRQAGIV